MVRQTASVVILEILGGIILLAVAACALLAARLASGPVQLDMFADDIAASISEARGGRDVEIDSVQLQWVTQDRQVKVAATGLRLFDDDGAIAAQAETALIDLDASALLRRRIQPLRMSMADGFLTVRQIGKVQWAVAGDPLPAFPDRPPPQTLEAWRDLVNDVLPAALSVVAEGANAIDLETMSFERMDIRVLNLNEAQVLSLETASGRLERIVGGLALQVAGRGVGEGVPQGIALDLDARNGFETLHGELALAGWSLAALAERLGLSQDRIAGLPADLAIIADAGRGGVAEIGLVAETGRGRLRVFDEDIAIDGGAINAAYNAQSDTLDLNLDAFETDVFSGDADISITPFAAPEDRQDFTLTSTDMTIDFGPVFQGPLSVSQVRVTGDAIFAQRDFEIDTARLRVDDAEISAEADLRFVEDGPGPDFRGEIVAEMAGELSTGRLIEFWPVRLGDGGRRFVDERVIGGTITEATFRMTVDDDTFIAEERRLRDGALELNFAARDVELAILSDMPNVTGAAGRGELLSNSLSIDVDAGAFSDWTITEGEVEFPQFMPRGERFTVRAVGSGDVTEMLRTLSESRLQLEARSGFDPEAVTGRGDAVFRFSRPALSQVPFDDVEIDVEARVRGGGFTKVAGGLDLTDASASVDVDKRSITIAGFGQLGPAPIQFTFRDGFDNDDAPSDLSASAVVTPDVLNRFGILGRSFLSGEIPVELQAKTNSDGIVAADASLDLSGARIDFNEIGWLKRAGEPAKATITYNAEDGTRQASARLESNDALFDGDIRLREDGQLLFADMRRAFLEDRADVSGRIARLGDGSLSVSLSGPFLDVSSAVPDLNAMGGDAGFDTPLTLDAEVDRLRLRSALELRGARMAMIASAEGLESFTAAGTTLGGAPLEAAFDGADGAGDFTIKSGDAGFLVSALIGADFLEGGTLAVDGALSSGDLPTKINVLISDARLRDAPFLTQILSLASLRGLADTLGGEGVLFSKIEVPIAVAGGRFVVDGGNASGPALGLTANGYIDGDDGGIRIDGVLVPSFGMNSALGGIPLIGDLVVGRDGEGVFSLTYSIRGSLDKAQVGVNPLSAVAPGILRRIFENPAQTDLPELEPRDPNDPIPSELEPLPPPEVIGEGGG